MAKIFILEDDEWRIKIFLKRYEGHEIALAHNYEEATHILSNSDRFDVAFLDRDLSYVQSLGGIDDELTGEDVTKFIINMPASLRPKRFIVHSWNSVGAKRIVDMLKDQGLNVVKDPFKA